MSTPLLQNILDQGSALQLVAARHFGEGSETLDQAAKLLRSKSRVVLTGMGASLFACVHFGHMLSRHGFTAAVVETAELLYFPAVPIDRETAVVLVSRSGESIEVTKLLPRLKEIGAATVGIVNEPDSTLARETDVCIHLGSPPDQLVAIQSYTATVLVFAFLEAVLAGETSAARAEVEGLQPVLAHWLKAWSSQTENWSRFLDGAFSVYILGRGPALGTVSEGVLLMHETAKMPAIGMSAAQFRHGPVEVTDSRFRGVILGTQSATAHLDRALAEDLISMGGQIQWIGPEPTGHGAVSSLVPWPETVPQRFIPILDVIPLQFLAYRAAELRGVRPGEFRWAPLVTNSEAGFTPRAAH